MTTTFDLDAPLASKAVDLGAQAAVKLRELGIVTYRDLLGYLPRRYEDRRALPGFASLVDGVNATVSGQVVSRVGNRTRRGGRGARPRADRASRAGASGSRGASRR